MKGADGRYRINVVAELTGVPAATLRAWERRHGIPTPARTAAAYRLYSDADVAEVRRLRDLCANGVGLAEAARVVRAGRGLAPMGAPAAPSGDLPPAVDLALEAILSAVREFDTDGIQREVSRALYLGNAKEVFERVYAPALQRIGDLWHAGALSVAQEHVASGVISVAASSLVRLVQPSEARWSVLLACVEEEDHCIGVHGAAIQLAAWGIRTVLLGARTPARALGEAIAHLDPDGVGLSITMDRAASPGAALVDAYADACEGRPWFVGGAGADTLAGPIRARGGLVIAGDLAGHRVAIERALTRRSAARET